MFIDIHAHAWQNPQPFRNDGSLYITPGELIARYDIHGVEKAVLLPYLVPECVKVPQSNERILNTSWLYPGRFVPFCNIDPRAMKNSADAPLNAILDYYRGKGCTGIGEITMILLKSTQGQGERRWVI